MEVEMKVFLEEDSLPALLDSLNKLGVTFGDPIEEKDVYFKEQGFREKVSGPGSYFIRLRYTSRGAVLNMKRLTERDGVWEEVETPVEKGEVAESIVQAIGAEHAITVQKNRKKGKIDHIEVLLDNVKGLGTYLEVSIETDSDIESAQQELKQFLQKLGVDSSAIELRGYPIILLEKERVKFSAK